MPTIGNNAQHFQPVRREQTPPGGKRLQIFVDVLLCGALAADHLPANEILVRHHDAEARVWFGDALHFFKPPPHVEEVLE